MTVATRVRGLLLTTAPILVSDYLIYTAERERERERERGSNMPRLAGTVATLYASCRSSAQLVVWIVSRASMSVRFGGF